MTQHPLPASGGYSVGFVGVRVEYILHMILRCCLLVADVKFGFVVWGRWEVGILCEEGADISIAVRCSVMSPLCFLACN